MKKLTKARRRVLQNIEAGRTWNHGGGTGMGGAARRMLVDMRLEGLVSGSLSDDSLQVTPEGLVALRGMS